MMDEDKRMDELTRNLFSFGKQEKLSDDFTDNVMNQILLTSNGTVTNISGIRMLLNNWGFIIPLGMIMLGFIYYWISNSKTINPNFLNLDYKPNFEFYSSLIKPLLDFITTSPVIIISIIALFFLLVFDRVITKFLHSF